MSLVNRYFKFFWVVVFAWLLFQTGPTWRSFFMADDFAWLSFAQNHNPAEVMALPSPGGWTTPVSNLLFWLAHRLFGLEAVYYYCVVFALHALNGWLVFLLAENLWASRTRSSFLAALFLLHFVHFSDWGPVVWIAAFVQPLASTFYLLSLLFYARYAGRSGRYLLAISLVFFVIALFAKETAASLPFVVLAWHSIDKHSSVGSLKWYRVLPYFMILVVYSVYELTTQSSGGNIASGIYRLGTHLATNLRFFSNLIMPNPTSPPVASFISTHSAGFASVLTIASYGSLLVLAVVTIMVWRLGEPAYRKWVCLMLLAYLPFLPFTKDLAGANRYFYLPSIGFAGVVVTFIAWVRPQVTSKCPKRWVMLQFCLLALLLGYNLVPIRLWQSLMLENSLVRRQAIALAEGLLERDAPIRVFLLRGFPEKYTDLTQAIPLFTGRATRFYSPDALQTDEVLVDYEALALYSP